MALSDGHPQAIPNAAMAAFDPPTYLQQQQQQQPYVYLDKTNYPNTDTKMKTNPISALISPEDEQQQLPCEQYKEFLDASHLERVDMIDHLVDVSVDIIDSIWPIASGHAKVVGTKGFIREILKRSKTTYFMLQVSLFYIFRVKRVVQAKLRMAAGERGYRDNLMCCGRRMFLASLMAASKYIHDKSYRNKAWADASGLTLAEINASEMAFLQMIDYRLYISKSTFEKWYTMLNQRLDQQKQLRQQQQVMVSMSSLHQKKSTPRQYPQQYNHHCLTSPKTIKKPTTTLTNPKTLLHHPIATATTNSKTTSTFVPSPVTEPLSFATKSAATFYPSPDSPY